ncbi:unnamed protein product [Sympodiomycopsis kandeliae]
MSFGRPQGLSTFKVTPPDRGSFPLDHDGECKHVIKEYMTCMKENKSESGKCRHLSKLYLQCRMENNLMEKDDMSNLGFRDETHQSDDKHQKDVGSNSNNGSGNSSGGGGRLV